ncbi:MAG TPA: hypothetical protein VK752_05300 [Bryobacteraceae bacterium]|jgi:hypothetical protein|nr:hypothetical protein [Bryobacteraceae bacterium]
MAAKKKSSAKVAKTARSARVAASLVAGKSVTRIAKEERVSRATASKEANSPEVQLLITSLVEAERDVIRTLFKKGLGVVEGSFEAERWGVDEEGIAVSLGPDHYARLTGVKCLTQLLTAGRQAVRPEPAARQTLTLEDLKKLASADRVN